MSSTWVDFKALRQQLRFAEVLKSFNVELKVKGDRATGFCPLPKHNGQRHSPSFSANLAKGIFQCFGCGAKGNALDFVALMRGVDPSDGSALRQVALDLQKDLGTASEGPKPEHARGKAKPAAAKAASRAKTTPDEQHGAEQDKPAQEKAEPASTGPAIVNTPLDFELKGLDLSHPYLKGRGFTEQTIEHFGLGYCGRGLMQGRIAIPLHDAQGRLIGYAGRLADDAAVKEDNPKYRFPGERKREGVVHEFRKSLLLYNHHRVARPVTDLIVVEGFASVWWLWQQGRANVVAVMGATCSAEQAQLTVDSVKPGGRVWILSDGDEAGVRCAHSLLTQVAVSRLCRWLKLNENAQPTDLTTLQMALLLEEVPRA